MDSALLGPFAYMVDPSTGRGYDPEGRLSTLPSLATALLALRAGCWLRQRRSKTLLLAGFASLTFGGLSAQWMLLNKNLWTPNFVLCCAGWSMLARLAFRQFIDRYGWPALGRRFGINAIAAYAGSELMQIILPVLGWQDPIDRTIFSGPITPVAGPFIASLCDALAWVVGWYLVAYAMDRRCVYLKL